MSEADRISREQQLKEALRQRMGGADLPMYTQYSADQPVLMGGYSTPRGNSPSQYYQWLLGQGITDSMAKQQTYEAMQESNTKNPDNKWPMEGEY